MKLLLLAHERVGERVLHFLLDKHRSDVALVVATEDNRILAAAKQAELPSCIFHGAQQLAEFIQRECLEFDLGLLAWWPTLVQSPLISLPRSGFINFHPSLLPHNRGKHYNFWAIVEEAPFGVSLHFVDEGVDSGDVVAQREIPYHWTDTGESLYLRAQEEIVRLFCESYPILRSLKIPRKRQDLAKGSFHKAAELEPASHIDLNAPYTARQLLNLLRARTFPGHPGCRFEDQGTKYEVRIDIRSVSE